jgi:hypothetical protein
VGDSGCNESDDSETAIESTWLTATLFVGVLCLGRLVAGTASRFAFLWQKAVADGTCRSVNAHHFPASVSDLDHATTLILARLDETHVDVPFELSILA